MTALKTFCDIDNNIVGYAISAITSSVDPVTCVSSFGLQAEYYDTDFNVLGSSLPAGWGECCEGGGGAEPVYLDVDGGVVAPSTPSIVAGAKYDSVGGLDLPTTGAGELVICSASGGGDGAKASEWSGDWVCPETDGTKIYQTAQGLRGVPEHTSVYAEIVPFGATVSNILNPTVPGIYTTPVGSLIFTNPSTCRAMSLLIQHNINIDFHLFQNEAGVFDSQGWLDNGGGVLTLDHTAARAVGLNGNFQTDTVIDDNKIQYVTVPAGATITLRHQIGIDLTLVVGAPLLRMNSHLSVFGVTL